MSLGNSVDNGAPLAFAGSANVSRIADADRTLNNGVINNQIVITAAAPRVIDLPLLSTVQNGDGFFFQNLGASTAALTRQGSDNVNDGAGPFTVAATSGVHVVADVAGGTWLVY